MSKKITFFFVAFFAIKTSFAQGSFENLTAKLDSVGKDYFKGVPGVAGTTAFATFGATFLNRNDTSAFGDYWSGWSISRLKDSISVAYDTNDCAAIPAEGHSASSVYATAFISLDADLNKIRFQNVQLGVMGFFITNSTIAYKSMLNGDGFAKKFGGVSGNDPDYLRMIIRGWNNGVLQPDSVVFYLADFRDTNNANDYIVNDWRYVNLGSQFNDSITYRLESSDNGGFGMNTPAYFCIDDIIYLPENVHDITTNPAIALYPNPVCDQLMIANKSDEKTSFTILTQQGALVKQVMLEAQQQMKVDAKSWSSGIYIVRAKTATAEYYYKLVR